MTCTQCHHFSLQADVRMAAQGYGACKKRPSGHYVGSDRKACDQFEQALDMVISKRVEFLKGKN